MQNTLDADRIAEETLHGVVYEAFIGGAWCSAEGGRTFPVTNPATGGKLADVPECGAKETLAAIDAASAVLPTWAATPAPTRGDLLRKV
ncbi:MAG TPA: aldehyde dehydrogenase family protein, partial [Aggregatilineales bacterium]|nr:aldehyde dehydrogenase family protein [Aggregatilineales bacterium]